MGIRVLIWRIIDLFKVIEIFLVVADLALALPKTSRT